MPLCSVEFPFGCTIIMYLFVYYLFQRIINTLYIAFDEFYCVLLEGWRRWYAGPIPRVHSSAPSGEAWTFVVCCLETWCNKTLGGLHRLNTLLHWLSRWMEALTTSRRYVPPLRAADWRLDATRLLEAFVSTTHSCTDSHDGWSPRPRPGGTCSRSEPFRESGHSCLLLGEGSSDKWADILCQLLCYKAADLCVAFIHSTLLVLRW